SIPSQFPGGCGATRSLHRGFAGPPPCADHRTPSLTAASRETVGAESASSSYIFATSFIWHRSPPPCVFLATGTQVRLLLQNHVIHNLYTLFCVWARLSASPCDCVSV